MSIARDVVTQSPWYPAVVLAFEGADARIGVEGLDAPQILPASAVTWARRPDRRKARKVADLLDVGEVIYVREAGGDTPSWSLHQIPEVQGGFVAMDVNSGRVLAMQGGFSYQHSVFNRATQALRQPGSSFKPFVYAAALDNGYSPATIVIDAPIEIESDDGTWSPQNYSDRFFGPTPVRIGIERSRNLMTVRLANELGLDKVADYAQQVWGVRICQARTGGRAWITGNHALSNGDRLCDVCQWRDPRAAHLGGPRPEPFWQDRIST